MSMFKSGLRWVAILGLGAWVAAGAWLVAVQVMLAVWDPMGTWQLPRISKVTITLVARDEDKKITGEVLALEGGKSLYLLFSKQEAAELDVDDDVWVLHNYRLKGNRPGHFRLTPLRLLLEYPEPWMALALWGIWVLRKRQIRAAREIPNIERKVWRDDFHERSKRFAPPKETKAP